MTMNADNSDNPLVTHERVSAFVANKFDMMRGLTTTSIQPGTTELLTRMLMEVCDEKSLANAIAWYNDPKIRRTHETIRMFGVIARDHGLDKSEGQPDSSSYNIQTHASLVGEQIVRLEKKKNKPEWAGVRRVENAMEGLLAFFMEEGR